MIYVCTADMMCIFGGCVCVPYTVQLGAYTAEHMYIDNDEAYIRIYIRFNGIYLPTIILQNYYYEILSVNDYQKVAVSSVIFCRETSRKEEVYL